MAIKEIMTKEREGKGKDDSMGTGKGITITGIRLKALARD